VRFRLLSRRVFLQLPSGIPRISRRFHDFFVQGVWFHRRLVPLYQQV